MRKRSVIAIAVAWVVVGLTTAAAAASDSSDKLRDNFVLIKGGTFKNTAVELLRQRCDLIRFLYRQI